MPILLIYNEMYNYQVGLRLLSRIVLFPFRQKYSKRQTTIRRLLEWMEAEERGNWGMLLAPSGCDQWSGTLSSFLAHLCQSSQSWPVGQDSPFPDSAADRGEAWPFLLCAPRSPTPFWTLSAPPLQVCSLFRLSDSCPFTKQASPGKSWTRNTVHVYMFLSQKV